MRFVVLALALLPAAALAEERDPAPLAAAPKCQNAKTELADKAPQPLRLGTLAEQPLATQYKAVLRYEDGCDVPVKVRENIGTKQR